MKKIILVLSLFASLAASSQKNKFIHTEGSEIIGTDGKPFMIRGTNLGNWMVPEGYMFKFNNTNSPRLINEMMTELLGPEADANFWHRYQDAYITQADIHYLKMIGVNAIRVPFNYRLFTNETYLGSTDSTRGFILMDRVIGWCKKEGIFVMLDMHCAPGGQTGDNIDDGYGYPFLFESEAMKQLTVQIWTRIADHYKNETTVMGYDLLNEPIAHYFNKSLLNPMLEPLYKRIVASMRTVDKNHTMYLGGAQWDSNFEPFGAPFDNNLVYQFHKYWVKVEFNAIKSYCDFRTKYNVPIYCGETGENNDKWVDSFRTLLDSAHIGWQFWPYKKMASGSNIVSVVKPVNWDSVIQYAESPRSGFKALRDLHPDTDKIRKALEDYLINIRFENCLKNEGYIKALGFKPGE